MSSIVLQPQLSPEDKNYLPQMPFCESHLHHSFFPVYLHPSWVFSGSYMEGLHRKSTKPRYREPRLSEVTFYCCDCYCFLSISLFTFFLSIISSQRYFPIAIGFAFPSGSAKFVLGLLVLEKKLARVLVYTARNLYVKKLDSSFLFPNNFGIVIHCSIF